MTSIDGEEMLYWNLESGQSLTTGIKASGLIDEHVTEFSKEIWKRVELLYEFADGGGGLSCDSESRVDKESLYSARNFLLSLPETFPLPKIYPDGDGGIMFVWSTPTKSTIMVIEGIVFHLVKNAGSDQAEYFDGIPLQEIPPQELIDALGE